jgi:hypothetical protein
MAKMTTEEAFRKSSTNARNTTLIWNNWISVYAHF